jgi:hypothetical protein
MNFQSENFGPCKIVRTTYSIGGALAVQIVAGDTADLPGEPIARISANFPGKSEKLPPNHFYCKDWSENMLIIQELIELGLIEFVEEFPPIISGFEAVDVYKLKTQE